MSTKKVWSVYEVGASYEGPLTEVEASSERRALETAASHYGVKRDKLYAVPGALLTGKPARESHSQIRRSHATARPKLKWFREGFDPHEDLYLIPVDQERTAEGDLNSDAAVAWIKIAYDRTRFYGGRGGEGTSRPDSYVAMILDGKRHRVITDGAESVAHIGGLFSDKADKSFRSLRAAKQAIAAELAKLDKRAKLPPSTATRVQPG